jgi:hypothetical protein
MRLLTAAITAAALCVPVTGHAADRRASAAVSIRPTLGSTAVDFASWARGTGGLVGYLANFSVHGTIEGQGYAIAVHDTWTTVVPGSAPTRIEHHRYPAFADSTVALVYTGRVVVPGGGVPTVYCQATVTRVGAGPVITVGSC